MKIAFFGSSLVSSYWNGAATYYRGLLSALARYGHDITFYEPDAYERQRYRDIADPPWARVEVWQADEDGWRRALDRAKDADLLIKASGVGVFDEALDEALPAVRRPSTTIAYWDVDAPATLERVAHDPADHMRSLIGAYDMVFTYGGGAPVVQAYRALGARQCVPIYNAADPTTHHSVPKVASFATDLGFLGNRLPDREARVEEFFLKPASLMARQSFIIGGSGWSDKPMPPNVRPIGHVRTDDHNAFNCSALAVLNIARDSMARFGFSPATRVFEASAAAACIISDDWEGMDAFFEPGREVLVARSGEEVVDHLASLHGRRAAAIGTAARRRVLSEHTYAHRAALLQEVLNISHPNENRAA